jgi:hypothetical protein
MRYIEENEKFEVFLVEGKEVKKQVTKNMEYYRKKGKKEFPYFSIDAEDEKYYKQCWKRFRI